MANGQQVAEENYAAFIAWTSSKTDDDFREYVYRGQLKRTEIAAECGFGTSALRQNPSIKDALKELENGLRSRGVLPAAKGTTDNKEPPLRDRQATQRSRDAQRVNALEQQNAALLARVRHLEAELDELNVFQEYLAKTGRLPQ